MKKRAPTFGSATAKQNLTEMDPEALLRLNQFVPGKFPVSRAGFYNKVKDGTFKIKPIRLGARCVGYKVKDILRLIQELENQSVQGEV